MKNLNIIKIGGNVIDSETALAKFLKDFAKIEGPKILIHGGGKLLSDLSAKLNLEVNMINGKRITNSETLKLATMVYAGEINKNITAQLQGLNCNAIGLSGADGNCIRASKRNVNGIDYGFVGDLNSESINTNFFNLLLNNQLVPVICAITHDKNGQLLNTNADTIASALSVALSHFYEVKLIYCFEKKGVLSHFPDEKSVIKNINPIDYELGKKNGSISKGMIPKLDNAFVAAENGVKFVKVGSSEDLLKLLSENIYEGTSISN